jgi:hypothetical protein
MELSGACLRTEFGFSGAGRISYEAHTINSDPRGMTLDGNRAPTEEVTLIHTTDGKLQTA